MSGAERMRAAFGWLVLTLALQPLAAPAAPAPADAQWLEQIRAAGRNLDYRGTFVVQSQQQLQTYEVEHARVQGHTLQLLQSEDGRRRLELRRDAQTWILLPGTRKVLELQHAPLPELLPSLPPPADLLQSYSVHRLGQQRCLGRRCDVTDVLPRDALRYGYRLWSDAQTHLLLKMQTLDLSGHALLQLAFTRLDQRAQTAPDLVARTLQPTQGWSHQPLDALPTTAAAEGWRMDHAPPGFRAGAMVRRSLHGRGGTRVLQWLFSDGLASVSLFIGRDLPAPGSRMRDGAIHALQIQHGSWRVVAIGNVPEVTLQRLVQGLRRVD